MLYNLRNRITKKLKNDGVYDYKKKYENDLKKASQSYEEIFITSFFI